MKQIIIGICLVLTAIVLFQACGAPAQDKKLVRVGAYDSRAVAMAYAGSSFNTKLLDEKIAERTAAKTAGDANKTAELEKWGKDHQDMMHRQGYGTASVKNLLEYIKDDLPKIAIEAGVDVLVSKWDIAYKTDSAELVDVTNLIVKPFKPSDSTLKNIADIQKIRPLTDKDIANLKESKYLRKKV